MPFIAAPNAEYRAIDYERFKAKFGVNTTICTTLWDMIATKLNSMASDIYRPFRDYIQPQHLLFALFFLKVYPRERQVAGSLGVHVGRGCYRKWSHFVIRMIAFLSNDVVSVGCICLSSILYFHLISSLLSSSSSSIRCCFVIVHEQHYRSVGKTVSETM